MNWISGPPTTRIHESEATQDNDQEFVKPLPPRITFFNEFRMKGRSIVSIWIGAGVIIAIMLISRHFHEEWSLLRTPEDETAATPRHSRPEHSVDRPAHTSTEPTALGLEIRNATPDSAAALIQKIEAEFSGGEQHGAHLARLFAELTRKFQIEEVCKVLDCLPAGNFRTRSLYTVAFNVKMADAAFLLQWSKQTGYADETRSAVGALETRFSDSFDTSTLHEAAKIPELQHVVEGRLRYLAGRSSAILMPEINGIPADSPAYIPYLQGYLSRPGVSAAIVVETLGATAGPDTAALLASRFANSNCQEAAAWMSGILQPQAKRAYASTLAWFWAQRDSNSASKWVRSLQSQDAAVFRAAAKSMIQTLSDSLSQAEIDSWEASIAAAQ